MTDQAAAIAAGPRTEAGKRLLADLLEWDAEQPVNTIEQGIRAIEEEAARLASPADREGQVAGIAAALDIHNCLSTGMCDCGDHERPADYRDTFSYNEHVATSLYDAGLRLAGQREDSPLDVRLLRHAIGNVRGSENAAYIWLDNRALADAIAAEYARLTVESR